MQKQREYWPERVGGVEQYEYFAEGLKCVNDEMYIDGDSIIQPDFSLIEISLEHCSEYTETNIECAREREIQNFWKEFFKYNVSYLTISAKQIDLQEIDDPIKNKY